jgi:hypothetical protein
LDIVVTSALPQSVAAPIPDVKFEIEVADGGGELLANWKEELWELFS